MGLFTELLLLPLAPVRGVTWVAEQVQHQVEHQLYDPGVVRGQIDELDAAHERGEITEAERDEQQEVLLQRLVRGNGNGNGNGDGDAAGPDSAVGGPA